MNTTYTLNHFQVEKEEDKNNNHHVYVFNKEPTKFCNQISSMYDVEAVIIIHGANGPRWPDLVLFSVEIKTLVDLVRVMERIRAYKGRLMLIIDDLDVDMQKDCTVHLMSTMAEVSVTTLNHLNVAELTTIDSSANWWVDASIETPNLPERIKHIGSVVGEKYAIHLTKPWYLRLDKCSRLHAPQELYDYRPEN